MQCSLPPLFGLWLRSKILGRCTFAVGQSLPIYADHVAIIAPNRTMKRDGEGQLVRSLSDRLTENGVACTLIKRR